MPPPNVGVLKDLFQPTFPESVGAFALDDELMVDNGGGIAGYDDSDNYRGFLAAVS